MDDSEVPSVDGGRGLLTDTDRQKIAGAGGYDRKDRYEAVSRARSRLSNLVIDLRVLEEHHRDLYEEVVEKVSEAEETSEAVSRVRSRLYDEIAEEARRADDS